MISGVTTMELTAIDNASAVIGRVRGASEQLGNTYARLSGLMAGIGVTALLRDMIREASEAEQQSNRLNAVLRATGHSAGITKRELDEMADSLARLTQFEDEHIRAAEVTLLKFGNIQGDVFRQAIKLTADYAALTGGDMTSAAQTVGKALQSPAEGLKAIQNEFGRLSPAQKQAIDDFLEINDLASAQGVVLEFLSGKIEGTAEAMNTGLLGGTASLKKAWGELLETFGRTANEASVVSVLLLGITRVLQGLDQAVQALNLEKLKAALTLNFRTPAKPDTSAEEAAARQAAQLAQWTADMERQKQAQLKFIEEIAKKQEAAAKKEVVDRDKYLKEMAALETKSLHDRLLAEEQMREDEGTRIREAFLANKKIQDDARKESAAGDIAAFAAKWDAAQELGIQLGQLDLKRIKAREKLEIEEAKKALDFRMDQERKAADELSRLIGDGIMRGFESGKSWAQNFRDMLVNMFKTLVLKPGVEFIVNPISSAISSTLGTAASGAGLLGSGFGALSAGYSGATLAAGLAGPTTAGATGMMGVGSMLGAIPGWGWAAAGGLALLSGMFGGDEDPQRAYLQATTSGAGGPAGKLAVTQYGTGGLSNVSVPAYEAFNSWLGGLPEQVKTAVDGMTLDLDKGTDQMAALGLMTQKILDVAKTLNLTEEDWRKLIPTIYATKDAIVAMMGGPAAQMELQVKQLNQAFSAAGVTAIPQTREEFAALVNSIDVTTESGQKLLAALVAIAPAFDAVEAAQDALAKQANDLTVQYYQVTGQTDKAKNLMRQLVLEGLNPMLHGLQQNIWAAEDLNEANRIAAETAKTRQDWQDQLDVLTGTRTQHEIDLQRDLASTTDAATQALIIQVYAQREMAAAAQRAAVVLAEGAQLAARYAQMTGDSTQSRILELQAIDPANRAWLIRIWALEQEQAAANNAAQSTNNLAESYRSVAQEQQKVLQGLVQFGRSIKDFLHSLNIGETTATPSQQFAAAQAQYLDNLRKARAGDTEAQGQLARDAQTYIEKAQMMFASGSQTQAIIAQIRAELGALPEVEDYDANLAALNAIQAVLATINTSVQSGGSNTVAAVNTIPFAIRESDLLLLNGLSAEFQKLDADLSGGLTAAEFAAGMAGKATDAAINALFMLADTNHDGLITAIEAVEASGTRDAQALLQGLVASFDAFDIDVSGGLTAAEFQAGMAGKATDAQLSAIFTLLDADNDGILSKLEIGNVIGSNTQTTVASQADMLWTMVTLQQQQWQFNDIFRTQNYQQYTMLESIRDTLLGTLTVTSSIQPAMFASGGMFGGGLRIVGEQGPELEVTGPSRIFSASETRGMLSGGADVAQEVRDLKATVKELLSRIAHGQSVQTTVIARTGDKTAKATADAAWRQEVRPELR